MIKGRLLFYSCLICLLHWGKQMIISPYGEFRFLFDIQINSLPHFIYFCHCWNCWSKKKKATLLCCFSVSWPSLLDRERKSIKYVYIFLRYGGCFTTDALINPGSLKQDRWGGNSSEEGMSLHFLSRNMSQRWGFSFH